MPSSRDDVRTLKGAMRLWAGAHLRARFGMLGLFCGSVAIAAVPPTAATFAAEVDVAMNRMMAGMAVKRSGDVDRDFVAMMVPHHQGAIDMAIAELRFGKDERLKRIAQEIIVEQPQEIAAMRLAVRDPSPSPLPAPTSGAHRKMQMAH